MINFAPKRISIDRRHGLKWQKKNSRPNFFGKTLLKSNIGYSLSGLGDCLGLVVDHVEAMRDEFYLHIGSILELGK